ncbi:hypothetical protein [Paenibacillus chitinolyticus]|uniref:hypothetical protein n=1 Tax=Paenibacillus chitinolyticus TaxID=79263 RepID=UPI00366A159E
MSRRMDKEAALEDFLEKHIFGKWQEDLMTVDAVYQEHRQRIEEEFLAAFEAVCGQAAALQAKGCKGAIRYIYFSLMRTSVMENSPCYRIEAYDENWLIDTADCRSEWRADFTFAPLFRRMEELEETKKSYARRVTSADLDRIKQIEAVKYHLLTVEFMRNMVPQLLACKNYQQMDKFPEIALLAGEYRDECQLLHGSLESQSGASGEALSG